MRHAQIISTGRYVPEKVITNAELDAMLGTKVSDWLVANVGIRERRVMRDDQVTSDLATAAAAEALERAGIGPADVDLIILATDTPDYISPGTASVVQYKLGATNAGTFDVNCACAAWVTGLDIAAKYMGDPVKGIKSDPQAAIRELVAESTRRWHREEPVVDDTTVIVAYFS